MTTFGTANMIAQSVNVNFPDLRLWHCLCYNMRMNKTVKIIKVGNSAAIILPKRDLDRLQAKVGDVLTKLDTDRGLELKPYDADFDAQMQVAREVMAQRKRALRELAK